MGSMGPYSDDLTWTACLEVSVELHVHTKILPRLFVQENPYICKMRALIVTSILIRFHFHYVRTTENLTDISTKYSPRPYRRRQLQFLRRKRGLVAVVPSYIQGGDFGSTGVDSGGAFFSWPHTSLRRNNRVCGVDKIIYERHVDRGSAMNKSSCCLTLSLGVLLSNKPG